MMAVLPDRGRCWLCLLTSTPGAIATTFAEVAEHGRRESAAAILLETACLRGSTLTGSTARAAVLLWQESKRQNGDIIEACNALLTDPCPKYMPS